MEVEPHPGTMERILEASLHALARRTPSGISMTDVAAQAGVSRGTVYRYFRDKECLLRAVADYERRRYETSVRAALEDVTPGPQQVIRLIDHTLAYFETHPSLGQLLEIEPGFVLENLRSQLPALQVTAEEFLAPVLADLAVVRSGMVTPAQLSVTVALEDLVGVLVTPTRPTAELGLAAHYASDELRPARE
jgi:AcrR family transcriptional regulator